jgi:eukaryotic-like serine/threonine-protein kinase
VSAVSEPGQPSAAAAAHWQRLSALFDEALDLAPGLREDWLRALREREPALAAELDRLLQAQATEGQHDPLAQLPLLGERRAPDAAHGLAPGQRVGPWSLVRLLGTGGMSVVWLAERADGAYEREVALKLPQRLPWRDDLSARLARERDILARLEHPHIARLYDAGVTEQDLPWLAMECVQGLPLTDWCDQRGSSLRARVQLFGQVLDAVSHAHGALVLHRDLKPSNILVTADGTVKLLDFGIAKVLDEQARVTADTQLTQLGGRAMTPDYASPEQIRGEPLTTASDVYALGVVLYELLCGERPYQLRHRSAAQLETAVLEVEPNRPSSRSGSSAVALARGESPQRLARALRGELDAIVLMAMRKRPEQRYPSAAALRADLTRWLEGQPVSARPDSWWYRSSRFVRRHRVGVGLGALIASLMLASTLLSVHQSQLAEHEARRARAALDFLQGLYRPVSWLSGNPARGSQVTAHELLDLSAQQLREQPLADPEVQREVLTTLAGLYADVGDMPGLARVTQDMVPQARAGFGPASVQLLDALVWQAQAVHQSNLVEAESLLAQADQLRRQLGQVPTAVLLHFWLTQGMVYEERDGPRAEQAFVQALALSDLASAPPRQRARALMGLAGVRALGQDRLLEARDLYQRAVDTLRAAPGVPVFELTEPEAGLADTERRLGHLVAATAILERIHSRCDSGLGPRHPDTVFTGMRLAAVWRQRSQVADAAALLAKLRAGLLQNGAAADVYVLPSLTVELAATHMALGQFDAAHADYQEAVKGLDQRNRGRVTDATAMWRSNWAMALAQRGQWAAADDLQAQAEHGLKQLGAVPRVARALLRSAAVLASARVASTQSAAPALQAIALWEAAELADPGQAQGLNGVRVRSAAALLRAQAWLLTDQPAPALAETRAVQAMMTPAVLAETGALELGLALGMAAEAHWRQQDIALACQQAQQAQDALAVAIPQAPATRLAQSLVQRCAAPGGASGQRAALTFPVGSPWAWRATSLSARPGVAALHP